VALDTYTFRIYFIDFGLLYRIHNPLIFFWYLHSASLRRADPSSGGVLPTAVCVTVISKPQQWGGSRAVSHQEKNYLLLSLCFLDIPHKDLIRLISAAYKPSLCALFSVAQAFSYWSVFAETRVGFQASPCGIYCGQSGTGRDCLPSIAFVPSQYHSAIHLPPTLYNLGSCQSQINPPPLIFYIVFVVSMRNGKWWTNLIVGECSGVAYCVHIIVSSDKPHYIFVCHNIYSWLHQTVIANLASPPLCISI
jgi:hypothetical protein